MIEKKSKVVLHLSKPWAMGEALGWAALPASVGRRDGDRWLVELDQPIRFDNTVYRYFVIAPRLAGWHLSDAGRLEVPCAIVPTNDGQLSNNVPLDHPEIAGSVTEYH